MKFLINKISSKKVKTNLDFKTIIILLLCGFLVFSPLSSRISQDILQLPLALPELIFVPFYFFLKRDFDITVNKKIFVIGCFLILLLTAISFVVGNFKVYSILSTARGYFYMLLFFSIFKNKKITSIYSILYISLGSVIGWLYFSLSSVTVLINNISDNPSAIYGNMINLSLAMSIPIIFKKRKYIVITFAAGLLLSLSTGTRRQIIIYLMSLVLSYLITVRLTIKSITKVIVSIIAFNYLLIFFLPNANQYVYDISPLLHKRIFVKSEQLISGIENDSDYIRKSALFEFAESYTEYIIPRGFVSKRTMADKGTGKYMDSPYYEIFYTFGLFGGVFIFSLLIRKLFFHLKNYYFKGVTESGVCVVSIIVIFVLIMVEGSFLNWSYITPCTGFILARIFSSKNLITL